MQENFSNITIQKIDIVFLQALMLFLVLLILSHKKRGEFPSRFKT